MSLGGLCRSDVSKYTPRGAVRDEYPSVATGVSGLLFVALWRGVAQEAVAGADEGGARKAFGVAVSRAVLGFELAGVDGGAGFAPADHGIAHGHPARVAGDALALESAEHNRRIEVERGGLGTGSERHPLLAQLE